MTDGTNDEATRDTKRSRRDLVIGAAGALGVIAAEQLMRATPAQAADGDPVYLGFSNFESGTTEITTSGVNPALKLEASNVGGPALQASNNYADGIWGQSANSPGVVGFSGKGTGVVGISDGTKPGVSGTSDDGPGVEGESLFSDHGMHGIAHVADKAGVAGENDRGDAVKGESGFAGNGVHGIAHSLNSSGVLGENDAGPAVTGISTAPGGTGMVANGDQAGIYATTAPHSSGFAVLANSPQGHAVMGSSASGVHAIWGAAGLGDGVRGTTSGSDASGISGEAFNGGSGAGTGVSGIGGTGVHGTPLSGGTGVLASPADDGTGLALDATGPAKFESWTKFALSGTVNIPGSAKSATVPSVSLRAGSIVLATIQNDVGVSVDSAIPDVGGSKVTINLNKSVPNGKTAKVAWFVAN